MTGRAIPNSVSDKTHGSGFQNVPPDATRNSAADLAHRWNAEADACFKQAEKLMPGDDGYELLLEKGSTLQQCAPEVWADTRKDAT